MTMRRVVVVGATGSIGRPLAERLIAEGRSVIGACRNPGNSAHLHLDLSAPSATWPRWPQADVTYICAGSAGLDACERDPVRTRQVNVDAVVTLARRAAAAGNRVVFVSSSHVFDGQARISRADDPRSPRTMYGRQKSDAESGVLETAGAAVLRLSKVVGPGDARLNAWRAALRAGERVEAFADLPVAPLSSADAVTALIDVGEAGQPGVFQLSGPQEETYFSMALAVAGHVMVPASLIVRASAAAAGIPQAFCPKGVLLEQTLPRLFAAAPLHIVVARSLL
jgi:dTDP-4-dehydrorhamnose reductase